MLSSVNKLPFMDNKNHITSVKSICVPFLQHFGCKDLIYQRIFKDSRYFAFGTNLNWMSWYFQHAENVGNIFAEEIQSHCKEDEFRYFLWPFSSSRKFLQALQQFNMFWGLNLYRKLEDSIELWAFVTDKQKTINNLINNLDSIRKFVVNFNGEAENIINCKDDSRLANFIPAVSGNCLTQNYDKQGILSKFPQQIIGEQCRIPIKVTPLQEVYLSRRQTECLWYISHGKTAKEVAKLMNLSPRTVEYYLQEIKNKTGINDKSRLIDCFWESENGYADF